MSPDGLSAVLKDNRHSFNLSGQEQTDISTEWSLNGAPKRKKDGVTQGGSETEGRDSLLREQCEVGERGACSGKEKTVCIAETPGGRNQAQKMEWLIVASRSFHEFNQTCCCLCDGTKSLQTAAVPSKWEDKHACHKKKNRPKIEEILMGKIHEFQ